MTNVIAAHPHTGYAVIMTSRSLSEQMQAEIELATRMVRLYCREHHGEALCGECATLLDYMAARLAHCPYGDDKPTCRKCPIHCYRPAERDRMRAVMRFAGPRLLLRGDLGALKHLLHDRKPVPERQKRS